VDAVRAAKAVEGLAILEFYLDNGDMKQFYLDGDVKHL
jgi:hypothetical protein